MMEDATCLIGKTSTVSVKYFLVPILRYNRAKHEEKH